MGKHRGINFGLTYNYTTNANGAPATNRLESVALNGVTQTTYSYDAAGNTVSGDGKTFAYDAVNRLKSVNSGASTYGYDGDGKRVRVTDSGAAVYYVYSSVLGQVAMETNNGAGVQRAYVYHDGRVVAQMNPDGQFYWRHTNHLGGTRAMSDINGNLAYKVFHDPYGQILNEWSSTGDPSLTKKKFTTYERDSATGLDYAGARMYNSARGKFLQSDPAGQRSAKPGLPESLNRYTYSGNDPINNSDPSGLDYDAAWMRFFGESACRSQGGSYFGVLFLPGNQVGFLCGGLSERILAPTKQMLEEMGDWRRPIHKLAKVNWNYGGNGQLPDEWKRLGLVGCGRIANFRVTSDGQLLNTALGRETNKINKITISGPGSSDDTEITNMLNNAYNTKNTWLSPKEGGIFPDFQGFVFDVTSWERLKTLLNGRTVNVQSTTILEFTDSTPGSKTASVEIFSSGTVGVSDCKVDIFPESGSRSFWVNND